MSGRNEELLSAYFDGELSDDEKSRAEQLLADDLAAREALDEMSEVSGWIRSLPRPTAPVELHDEVLSRIRGAATPAHNGAALSRPAWRRHFRWIAATAASLIVAVGLYRTWPGPDSLPEADALKLGGDTADLASAAAAPAIDAPARTASIAEDPTVVAITNSGLMLDSLARSLESGAPPVPGELVHDVAQVGDQVLLFNYRVVDSQDLPGQVQLILANNGISTVEASPSAGQTVADFDANGNGQLEAIYLDAPITNFNTAVAQITDLDQVTSVLTNNVSLAEPGPETSPQFPQQFGLQYDRLAESLAPESEPPPPSLTERRASSSLQALSDLEAHRDSGIHTAARGDGLPPAAPAPATVQNLPLGVAATTDLSIAAGNELSEEKSIDRYELVQESEAGRSEVAGEEEPLSRYAAFQCAVPVPESLWFRLQQNEEQLSQGRMGGAQTEWRHQQPVLTHGRQLRFFAASNLQGSPAPDRIRAVILLVPQKSE